MALESKPLLHPEVLRQQVRSFNLPAVVGHWQPKLQHWAGLIASGRAGGVLVRERPAGQFLATGGLQAEGPMRPAAVFNASS